MSRALFILANQTVRERVKGYIDSAPEGYRVILNEPKRSTAQNDRMWAMLTKIAAQLNWHGVKPCILGNAALGGFELQARSRRGLANPADRRIAGFRRVQYDCGVAHAAS